MARDMVLTETAKEAAETEIEELESENAKLKRKNAELTETNMYQSQFIQQLIAAGHTQAAEGNLAHQRATILATMMDKEDLKPAEFQSFTPKKKKAKTDAAAALEDEDSSMMHSGA